MYAAMDKIPTVIQPASRTVARIPVTIPPGGTLAVPHTLGFSAEDTPAGLPGFLSLLIGLSLQSNLHPFNPLYIAAPSDDVNVYVGNIDANPADCVLDVVLPPPWLALDGFLGPGGVGPRNVWPGFASVPPAGTQALGPYNLTDANPPAPPYEDPIAIGHIPVLFVGAGDWVRYNVAPFVEPVGILDDGGGEDLIHFGATWHSVNRYNPAAPSTPADLYNVIGPITLPPLGGVVLPHNIRTLQGPQIPDLCWVLPVGSAAPGIPLGAPNYLTRDDMDQANVTITNQNAAPGSDVTFLLLAFRQWSGGRIA